MDKRLLQKHMDNYKDNITSLAQAIGRTPGRLCAKMNKYRNADFTQKEIMIIKTRYNLSPETVDAIFFDK